MNLNEEDLVPEIPFQRGELLIKLNRIVNLQKLVRDHAELNQLINEKENLKHTRHHPRNPREDIGQKHDDKMLLVWKRLHARQVEQIRILEEQIRKDIEDSKK